jgi:crotonobetainyl-CoA:carnitine CoA-transferase CaiB-like acyl-CoA transferase
VDQGQQSALQDLTIVECAEEVPGPYCGKLLADLGADVIKIEPPAHGDAARRMGPFYNDDPSLDNSLLFGQDHRWHAWVEVMGKPAWAMNPAYQTRVGRTQHQEALWAGIEAWAAEHTKEDIYRAGQSRRVPVFPYNTVAEAVMSAQVQSRNFVKEIPLASRIPVEAPSAPYQFSRTPWRLRRAAPRLGQHNHEIFCGRLGLAPEELVAAYEAGLALAKSIIAISAIVVENFAYGVMEKVGLTYDTVRAIRPDIIMLASSAMGKTGPDKAHVAYGRLLHAFSGLNSVTGYPGQGAANVGGTFTDPLTGTTMAFALLAALWHRRRTGEGQFIDLSMVEATLMQLPEFVAGV